MSTGRSSGPFRSAGDAAIIEILDGTRHPTAEDTVAIVTRMAVAPFDTKRRNLPQPLVDLIRAHGYSLTDAPTEFTHHWAKHVLGDGQWISSTTGTRYLEDLRQAILHPASMLILHRLPGGRSRAIVIASTEDVIPSAHRGPKSGPETVVVYSADTGKIVRGYMVKSSFDLISRSGTIWLRR